MIISKVMMWCVLSIWPSSEKMVQLLEALMIQTSNQILKHLACKAGVVSNPDKITAC